MNTTTDYEHPMKTFILKISQIKGDAMNLTVTFQNNMMGVVQDLAITIPILQAKFYYIPPLEGRFQTFWGIDI